MQGKSDATTHEEYIERLSEPRRAEIKALHELIRQTVPQLVPTMEFGMPGYGKFHYRYATGREGDWMLIGLASNKNYISLYVMAAAPMAATLPRPTRIGCPRRRSARAASASSVSATWIKRCLYCSSARRPSGCRGLDAVVVPCQRRPPLPGATQSG